MRGKAKKKIAQSLIHNFFLMAFCPMLIVAVLSSAVYARGMYNAACDNLHLTMSLYVDEINRIIEDSQKIMEIVQNDLAVQNMLRVSEFQEKKDFYVQKIASNSNLMILKQNYGKDGSDIYIILDDGRCFKSSVFPYRRKHVVGETWYQEIRESDSLTFQGFYEETRVVDAPYTGYIAAGMPIMNYRTGETDGIIFCEISLERLNEIMGVIGNDTTLEVHLSEADGTAIWDYHAKRSVLDMLQLSFDETLKNGWQVTMTSNWFDLVKHHLFRTFFVLVIAEGVMLLIAVRISNQTAGKINRPLQRLLLVMKENENRWVGNPVTGETEYEEVEELYRGVNHLMKRVNQMLEEVKESERHMRRVQFSALQAQINPHFLYNTLDHISWQIRVGQQQVALKSLMSLSRFLRISLRIEEELIALQSELEHVMIYMDLQLMRYGDMISFSLENELDKFVMESLIVPKFTLQPLVENCIYHGLRDCNRKGKITLHLFQKQDKVYIQVEDNGKGIPPDALMKLQRVLRTGETEEQEEKLGYGIANVGQRIRYLYGEKYTLFIESIENIKTIVTVCIPVGQTLKDTLL